MLKEKANKPLIIAIAEPSEILREGLRSMLIKSQLRYEAFYFNELEEIAEYHLRKKFSLAIISPLLIINRVRLFSDIKERCPGVTWIAIQSIYFDSQISGLFHDTILLYDNSENIVNKLKKLHEKAESALSYEPTSVLSDRETEVLQHLASGLSNKEIADILNISVNTVITHRKNITQKTGIKTVSGLTIFAISQGLIKP
ncbi:MAG: LuxR C-terminal-related transcriptional regulator [Bacteroidales bacterium]|nr:LuxR C-terminal-related transcriptional regulator [Bacteroidales bacterium]